MGGTIYEDTRQHEGKHKAKHLWWAEHGVEVVRRKLSTGDYMRDGSNYTVDTKCCVNEVAQNVCGNQHDRFRRECERARSEGCVLVVLVENRHGYREVGDVVRWRNRYGKVTGKRLLKALLTMQERYGVRFEFCGPRDSARRICEILGVEYEQDAGGGAQAAPAGLQDAPD